MFRNKILVRARPPFSSSSSPFLLLQLRLDLLPSPSSPMSTISDPGSSADSCLFVKIEALCWKLSRAWGVACMCFPQSPDINVVYQRPQSESVDHVVRAIAKELPIDKVGPEEELAPSSLVVKAHECALRCAFLDRSWRCLGNSLFVDSDFSCNDERSHVCALDVRVQSEMDDGFMFLVSPDVVRFNRYQIADLLSPKMELNFYNGEEVILEGHNSGKPCYVLPSLDEGYVIGLGKVLPLREDICQLEDLWSFKHGLALPNDYFIKIQFTFGGQANKKWFPSAFVLQGSSLAPAPQTSRIMKAVSALDSFVKIIEGWNLFGQGLLIVQVASSFTIGSELFTWTKAADAVKICVSRNPIHSATNETISTEMSAFTDLISANDFRTPKPAACIVGYRRLEHAASLEDISTSKQVCKTHLLSSSPGKTTGTDNEDMHMSAQAHNINDVEHNGIVHNEVAAQADGVISQTTFKDSGENVEKVNSILQIEYRNSLEKQKSKPILDKGSLTSTMQDHSEDDTAGDKENITKKKPKISSGVPDATAKVLDYHASGHLESLTVAELKRFLTSKKAKVGGRKKDLIQRITDLLD